MPSGFAFALLAAGLLLVAESPSMSAGVERPVQLPVVPESDGSRIVSLRAGGPPQVLVPGGSFVMGSSPSEIDLATNMCKREPIGDDKCERVFVSELEPHEVTLSPFYIDRTEVTVAAYRRCVEFGRCVTPPYASGGERFDRPEYPVTLVSWSDADTYCHFVGARLPTEAEWERAARGTASRRFPWGNLYNKSFANHGKLSIDNTDDSDGFAELAPVASFPSGRTPDGIDDMAGNVEEWVADAIDDKLGAHYAAASEVNPIGTSGGAFRVIRGGSYRDGAAWLRAPTRVFRLGSERTTFRGFRCVRPANEGL